MGKLDGRIALITGDKSGIDLATATNLLREGRGTSLSPTALRGSWLQR